VFQLRVQDSYGNSRPYQVLIQEMNWVPLNTLDPQLTEYMSVELSGVKAPAGAQNNIL